MSYFKSRKERAMFKEATENKEVMEIINEALESIMIKKKIIEESCYPICLETKGTPSKKNTVMLLLYQDERRHSAPKMKLIPYGEGPLNEKNPECIDAYYYNGEIFVDHYRRNTDNDISVIDKKKYKDMIEDLIRDYGHISTQCYNGEISKEEAIKRIAVANKDKMRIYEKKNCTGKPVHENVIYVEDQNE